MKTKLTAIIGVLLLAAHFQVLASGEAVVNEKLVRAFKEAFPKAQTVSWQEHGDFYFVHFKVNEIATQIEYDCDGNLIASERYFTSADILPLHLAWQINRKFKGKTIYGIVETNQDEQTSYYIKLQDNKEWITVVATASGTADVIERFNKQ